jgi:hypothetical protein
MKGSIPWVDVYVWRISFDVKLKIQSVTRSFLKTKQMSIDIYIPIMKYHLNVICLVVHVISTSSMSINKWYIFSTNHTTCQIMNHACQSKHALLWCKIWHVKCRKLAQKYMVPWILDSSHTTCQILNRACQLKRILFWVQVLAHQMQKNSHRTHGAMNPRY